MPVLDITNLKAYYFTERFGKTNQVKAVDNISFQVRRNEIYGIAGESGCGKSTLLRVVSGLAKPPLRILQGEISYNFDGRQITMASTEDEKEIRKLRGTHISTVPQASMNVLNPVRRIEKSFRDFIEVHIKIEDKEQFNGLVAGHLEALGLDWDIMYAYPHQLSGGMRQRVIIALATILKPDIIFADEPTTALDVVVQRGVMQLIKKIKEEQQNTVIMVTHDMAVHANLCDRMGIMYAGKLVEEADVNTLFYNSQHPYTTMLLRSLPQIGDKEERESAPGAPPSLIDVPSGCRFHPRCPRATKLCRSEDPPLEVVGEGHRVACFHKEGA